MIGFGELIGLRLGSNFSKLLNVLISELFHAKEKVRNFNKGLLQLILRKLLKTRTIRLTVIALGILYAELGWDKPGTEIKANLHLGIKAIVI